MIAVPRKKPDRARHILQLLAQHGPLSHSALKQMLSPPVQSRRLHDAIARLERKGFVSKRNEKVFGRHGIFYQLNQDSRALEAASQFLNKPVSDLAQPHFRYRELLHSESCALWSHELRKLRSPKLVRDFDFEKDKSAKEIMLTDGQEMDLRPDILLTFPASATENPTVIAVEVEKTRKTFSRLRQKLLKYANGTHVDGLIYACDSDQIANAIQQVYQAKPLRQSKRIGHYWGNFLLFGDAMAIHTEGVPGMFNSLMEPVCLKEWTTYLRATRFNFRRDGKFPKPAQAGWFSDGASKDSALPKNKVVSS